ncbi:hypothetical protein JT90_15525 [Listeria monocytogenes]|uniref:CHAP domain-containing protein n=3 Tax=Listeria TaxID=1637 RepID=A0A684G0N1_LISMN|nr:MULTISPECIES: hypothetical protein [Listeria]EEQ0538224.1 hypothetical protein [Listeria innocua]AMD28911.1 hypothetical protein KO07_15280 [Listeria monocytogenes]EAA0270743.1 hypothetical protein [Listeria monocytogenes]EAC2319383.1 hypothetical protein [Listeria monocytogenes]EAC2587777.1 hypothetical protein [Listeria monocytogenes]
MKKRMYCLVMLLAFVLLVSLSNQQVAASETGNDDKEIQTLYQKAINEKKVDPNKYTFEAFQENYNLGKMDYYAMKDIIGSGLDYNNWFGEIMNYGAFPDGEGHSPSEAKSNNMLRSQTSNGNKLEKAIKKGDILIVKSSSFGHAAIATSNKYILEMSGGGNPSKWATTGIKNNNHQLNKHKWIFGGKEQDYIKKPTINYWIQLWRVPQSSIANKAASYADKTYWNSNHKYEKNKHITYNLRSGTLTRNPNYCSKMVYQAYYYGTGNANVIETATTGMTFVSPAAIPNTFTGKYAPKKVGTY